MATRANHITIIFLLCLFTGSAWAGGNIYVGKDAKGNLFFTDTPPKYGGFSLYMTDTSRSGGSVADYKRNFTTYDDLIRHHSEKNGLKPSLVKAVIFAESAFNPNAVSHAGAQGLMQLMPHVQERLEVTDPFDPEASISGGTTLLGQLVKRYPNSIKKTLAAYNAGPNAVERYGGVPPFEETQNYVTKVMRLATHFDAKGLSALP